jgi:hypothetical protein
MPGEIVPSADSTTDSDRHADRRELFVPALGGTVRPRPVPPNLLVKAAGDPQKLMVLKLVHGLEDPQFTEAEARALTLQYTSALQPILDRIDEGAALTSTSGSTAMCGCPPSSGRRFVTP